MMNIIEKQNITKRSKSQTLGTPEKYSNFNSDLNSNTLVKPLSTSSTATKRTQPNSPLDITTEENTKDIYAKQEDAFTSEI